MRTAAGRSASWMWEIMQEAADELQQRPEWEVEMLRNAPRMYPSIRAKSSVKAPISSRATVTAAPPESKR